MNLREFKRAYKKLVSNGWEIISNNSCVRVDRKKPGPICHCPVTAVANVTTGFKLRGALGTRVTYRAGKTIGLSEHQVFFIMCCADLSVLELYHKFGQRRLGKQAVALRHFLVNPTA